MKKQKKTNIFLVAFLILVAGLSASNAAAVTESSSAPTQNIIVSQLTDLGPGDQNGSRNYTDNFGPPGQTFMVPGSFSLTGFTLLGRNDAGADYGTFRIQLGSVAGNGAITQLSQETGSLEANPANFVTFTLDTPITVNAGVTYAFSIYSTFSYYGLAHSANGNDAYPDGTAFNNNSSTTGGGGLRTFNGFVNPDPGNYDYVFAAHGFAVPEPSTFALIGLTAFGVLCSRRRPGRR